MLIEHILDKEDRELLHKDLSDNVKCPKCGKVWSSPYPSFRKWCEECFARVTGSKYIK